MSVVKSPRLAAAVLGASLVAGLAAGPAAAATWTAEHGVPGGTFSTAPTPEGLLEFTLMDNFTNDTVRVVAVAADGTEVEVPFEIDTVLDYGVVDLPGAVDLLGDSGADGFELRVIGAGQLAFGAEVSADGTITPVEDEEFFPFEDWAENSTWSTVIDQNEVLIQPILTTEDGVELSSEATLVAPPAHGKLVIGDTAYTYTPEKDYLGEDTFTVQITVDGESRVVTYSVIVADLPGEPEPVEPIMPAEPEPTPAPAPSEESTPAPTEAPTPSDEDAAPAPTPTPADEDDAEDETAVPAEGRATEEHAVPEKVQTDGGQGWLLAGAAALAAGALVRLRGAFTRA